MDSRALDINARWCGVSTQVLMENAGKAVAGHCLRYDGIAVFCGNGNNGGDGLVAARILKDNGKSVTVFVLEGMRSRLNGLNLKRLAGKVKVVELKSSDDVPDLSGFDLIVDALLGVGFHGKLREPLAGIVGRINESRVPVLSVDVPSGFKVKADKVISLHESKLEGAVVAKIGIPKEAELYCGPGDVYLALPERRGDSHKGDYGRLIVVGGSRNYVGTTTLVAEAALRVGVDLVTIFTPSYAAERMPFNPNLMIHPLRSKDHIALKDVPEILDARYDAMVVGNGLGRDEECRKALKKLFSENKKPVVVDADALSIMDKEWINENMILTPHHGEFKMLFGVEGSGRTVEKNAVETKATIVLKGPVDVISNGKVTRLNKTGNPGMTKGGSGDTLAGITAGLLAQNGNLMNSACAGAFLNGLAGDIAYGKLDVSMNATDIIEHIPDAIRKSREVIKDD
ncbi:MAG: NAD(P)H-hydrate dehydratase [Candidatus Altiarchaeota archaeon]|nr:NAD(P)H-hydrate dehydratase [Candidatus Altiarchaeota archaeon]